MEPACYQSEIDRKGGLTCQAAFLYLYLYLYHHHHHHHQGQRYAGGKVADPIHKRRKASNLKSHSAECLGTEGADMMHCCRYKH